MATTWSRRSSARVDNSSVIAQEEIFGPVLTVIPADNEEDVVAIANDTVYGLNASVFTPDVDRARQIARRLRSGTVGHNAFRTDFGIAFGGFKQSGIGREGGTEGLLPFLETKTVILEGVPAGTAEPDRTPLVGTTDTPPPTMAHHRCTRSVTTGKGGYAVPPVRTET